MKKTREHEVYLETTDDEAGRAVLERFVVLLSEMRHEKGYVNGWMSPKETKRPRPKKPRSSK